MAIFVHGLWLLKYIFIIIIQLVLSIFIRVVIVILILALVIHGLLERSCMELLLLSGVNSLAVYGDVDATTGLHAALVEGNVDAVADAKTLKQLGDVLSHVNAPNHLRIGS